ncbi:hypothetical protein JW898_02725 [Candidatus Woesearchaeota archaeon]|nr:hypothetical protein [Candidatus Woesearchaeota archaeon]
MVESRSKKISVLIFLFAIFILLVVVTGSWLYRMYTEQTAYSESRTLATVECSRYYYSIDPGSVLYENGTLYFEISNTLGADISTIVVESTGGQKEVDVSGLGQGATFPVSVRIDVVEWAVVYPSGCKGVNFKNLSFEPNTV